MSSHAACHGSLISRSALQSLLASDIPLVDAAIARQLRAIVRGVRGAPGAPSRAVADLAGRPLARLLGYQPLGFQVSDGLAVSPLAGRSAVAAWLVCVPAGTPIAHERVRIAIAMARHGARWALVLNGPTLVLLDCLRVHARRWLAFELPACAMDPAWLQVLLAVARADTIEPDAEGRRPLDTLIASSDAGLATARAALQHGVEIASLSLTRALAGRARRGQAAAAQLFEEALTVVYRILFLQFAESRGLVPTWHPTYREAYTIDSLRAAVQGGDPRGTWDALQAIARLAHRGARAGDLTVVPFNGRLFSPAHAPIVSTAAIGDGEAAAVVSALTLLQRAPASRPRTTTAPQTGSVPYLDLGVEQLGSIYERVLDFTPEIDRRTGAVSLTRGGSRKHTGSFYTPRPLAEFLVRRALAPLTEEATPDEILQLKVLDPSMGSGAFLVAACRYLAFAYEAALVRGGVAGAADFSPADRAGFRRLVARRCLYGVDVNPMAVQLGRLSLWLCALAADRPLTFLDHRLRVGNSVLGAAPGDVGRRAPGGRRSSRPTLFEDDSLEAIGRALDVRLVIAATSDDSLADVHAKEALLAELDSARGPLHVWRSLCDAWCAAWFWPDATAPGPREFGALAAGIRGDETFSHPAVRQALRTASDIARRERFFHWPLEFPEARDGFDAVVGNPPWEMLRADSGCADARGVRQTLRFTRDSGVYALQSTGHGNAYQLFLERTLQLLRPGGRAGLVLPWGLFSDEGSASLRRALLERCGLDDLVVLDNAEGIFPIHRALRFVALCATLGGPTGALRYGEPVRDLADLDRRGSDEPARRRGTPVELSRDLLVRLSGDSLSVPWVSSAAEVELLDHLTRAAPAASDAQGWGLRFARELNATEDRALFSAGPAESGDFPVIAGRHLRAFRVEPAATTTRIASADARARLGPAVLHSRLAYRDVAGAGNRMTLIAAIVPPRVVTTHTLFCLRGRYDLDEQHFLCGVLNSYVANYLVRTRVSTHVTTSLVHGLPVPRPGRTSAAFLRIVEIARALAGGATEGEPELQATIAHLYGLDRDRFALVLDTFPLVPRAQRDAALAAWAGV